MTDQTNTEELTDLQKAELAEQEKNVRTFVRIQEEERAKKEGVEEFSRLGSMSNAEFQNYTRKKFGY